MTDPSPERNVLEQLARDLLTERRRTRRWRIFFRLAALAIAFVGVLIVLAVVGSKEHVCLDQCTAVVEVRGELESGGRASAERVIAGLQAAFKHGRIKGVIVRINSPGGSPVQAGQIYDEIVRLRSMHPTIPIHAVVEEIAASGGYYIAAAGEKIFVDKASIVGSIGVIMDGFGFTGAMDKLGVERRVLTAGENKALMDPYSPFDARQRAHVQRLLDDVHAQFVTAVKEGRGPRLKENADTFSGLVWNGSRAVDLGLADGIGSVEGVARDIIKAEELVDFTPEDNIADRFARRFGAAFAGELAYGVRQARWR